MASFYLKVTPTTTAADVARKLLAFKELYGDPAPHVTAETNRGMGTGIELTSGEIAFPSSGVDVTRIGRKYLSVKGKNDTYEPWEGQVDLTNPDHGIGTIVFLTRSGF